MRSKLERSEKLRSKRRVPDSPQAVGAFVRGTGPAIAGLEWSAFLSIGGPLHQFGSWTIIALTSLIGIRIYNSGVDFDLLLQKKAPAPAAAAEGSARVDGVGPAGAIEGGATEEGEEGGMVAG